MWGVQMWSSVLITEAVIEYMDMGFFPSFHHTGLPRAGLDELTEQGPPHAEGVGRGITCVYVCIYAHMYIFIQQVCTLGFSLVVETGDLAPNSALNSARWGRCEFCVATIVLFCSQLQENPNPTCGVEGLVRTR